MRFLHGLGGVITIARAALVRVGRAHAVAVLIKDAGQERGRAPQPATPRHRLGRKLALYRRKQHAVENGLMLTAVNMAPIDHLGGGNAARAAGVWDRDWLRGSQRP